MLADSGALHDGQYVVHTSGRHGLAVLEPARAVGARVVAMHPAMTFTGTAVDLDRLAGCVFGVTAGARGARVRRVARRRPRRQPDVGARGDAHALPRRPGPRRQPPGHPGHRGDGDPLRGRRRGPGRHAAPAAHRRPRQRPRARRRRADRPDRPRRRRHRPRPPRGHRAPTRRRPCRPTSRWRAPRSTAPSPTAGCCRSGPPGSATCSTPRSPAVRCAECDDRRARPSHTPARSSTAPARRRPPHRPAGRLRADHGRPARGPRQPAAGGPRRVERRSGGRVDLREPAAVRAERGPRPLPPHPRRRPRGLRARGRRRGLRADGRGGLPGLAGAAAGHRRARAARHRARGQDPARPLPRRADRGRQALRPGPPRRRGLRPEGLPAAGADPPDGRRPVPGRRGRRRRDRSASPTGSPCRAATATSTPTSGCEAVALQPGPARRPADAAPYGVDAALGAARAELRSHPRRRPRLPRGHRLPTSTPLPRDVPPRPRPGSSSPPGSAPPA